MSENELVTNPEQETVIDNVEQPLLADVEYVTTYRGSPVPEDKKSVTVTLEYRSESGTLTHENVDEQEAQIVSALQEKLNAELRQ